MPCAAQCASPAATLSRSAARSASGQGSGSPPVAMPSCSAPRRPAQAPGQRPRTGAIRRWRCHPQPSPPRARTASLRHAAAPPASRPAYWPRRCDDPATSSQWGDPRSPHPEPAALPDGPGVPIGSALRHHQRPLRLRRRIGLKRRLQHDSPSIPPNCNCSSSAPPKTRVEWLSTKPGNSVRPPASRTRVAGPAKASTPARLPTAGIPTPPARATASARGRSRVHRQNPRIGDGSSLRIALCPSSWSKYSTGGPGGVETRR